MSLQAHAALSQLAALAYAQAYGAPAAAKPEPLDPWDALAAAGGLAALWGLGALLLGRKGRRTGLHLGTGFSGAAFVYLVWAFGADLTYECVLLGVYMGVLIGMPLAASAGTDPESWRSLVLRGNFPSDWERTAVLSGLISVTCGWISGYTYPLDWIFQWKYFPVPTLLSLSLGYLASALALPLMSRSQIP